MSERRWGETVTPSDLVYIGEFVEQLWIIDSYLEFHNDVLALTSRHEFELQPGSLRLAINVEFLRFLCCETAEQLENLGFGDARRTVVPREPLLAAFIRDAWLLAAGFPQIHEEIDAAVVNARKPALYWLVRRIEFLQQLSLDLSLELREIDSQ